MIFFAKKQVLCDIFGLMHMYDRRCSENTTLAFFWET